VFLVVDFCRVFWEIHSSNLNSEKSFWKIRSRSVSSTDWILKIIIFHFSKSLSLRCFFTETQVKKNMWHTKNMPFWFKSFYIITKWLNRAPIHSGRSHLPPRTSWGAQSPHYSLPKLPENTTSCGIKLRVSSSNNFGSGLSRLSQPIKLRVRATPIPTNGD
jgi:hypothetical protein